MRNLSVAGIFGSAALLVASLWLATASPGCQRKPISTSSRRCNPWFMVSADDGDWAALPAAALNHSRGKATRMEVDGEAFDVRRDGNGNSYDWLSGPNEGYGFGSSPAIDSAAAHVENIRSFLSMIDPATGYIAAIDTKEAMS